MEKLQDQAGKNLSALLLNSVFPIRKPCELWLMDPQSSKYIGLYQRFCISFYFSFFFFFFSFYII